MSSVKNLNSLSTRRYLETCQEQSHTAPNAAEFDRFTGFFNMMAATRGFQHPVGGPTEPWGLEVLMISEFNKLGRSNQKDHHRYGRSRIQRLIVIMQLNRHNKYVPAKPAKTIFMLQLYISSIPLLWQHWDCALFRFKHLVRKTSQFCLIWMFCRHCHAGRWSDVSSRFWSAQKKHLVTFPNVL